MKMLASKLCGLSTIVALAYSAMQAPSEAQTATTDPVGFITLTIKGTGGTQPNAITFLGLGMTRPVEYTGVADTVAGAVITSANATWTDNQYASTPAPGYFLEVTSGPKAGLMSLVVSCNDAANTLTVNDDLQAAGVGNGVSFKLRKDWSIGSLFGNSNEAGLGGGSSTSADLILIWNPSLPPSGGYDQFYYQTSGFGGVGWRKIGGGVSTDQKDAPVLLDDGLVVKRFQSADVNVVLTGAVKLGQTESLITVGTNIIGNVYPSGTLTLGSSNLYTGNAATGVAGGTSTTADLVSLWNPALPPSGGYDQYYYQTSGFGGTGWRLIGGGVSTDQAATQLPVGRAVLIRRKAAGNFSWVVPQPFPNP